MSPNPTAHPSWCDQLHDSHVHRGVVDHTTVGGRAVAVVIFQLPGGEPSVSLTGPGVVGIATDDCADAAELLDLCGQPTLAALIRKAGQILEAA